MASREEANLYGYIPEYSTDGISFTMLKTVKSEGANHIYKYVHHNAGGLAYYRLKMLDNDGKYKYSETRTLFSKSNSDLTIVPGPATDRIYVYTAQPGVYKKIEIITIEGVLVKGTNSYKDGRPITLCGLPKGTYALKVSTNDTEWSKLFLKN